MKLSTARAAAGRLAAHMLGAADHPALCLRADVVGSVRRGCDPVSDIDVVCEPVHEDRLFEAGGSVWRPRWGEPFLTWVRGGCPLGVDDGGRPVPSCRVESASIRPTSRQLKLRSIAWPDCKVELYLAPNPSYGWIQHLRTGPPDYARALVIEMLRRGVRASDGCLWIRSRDGYGATPLVTPTEIMVMEFLGLPFRAPDERWSDRLRADCRAHAPPPYEPWTGDEPAPTIEGRASATLAWPPGPAQEAAP